MIRELIALAPESKVWIYQADREITMEELDKMRPRVYDFVEEWTSHSQELMSYGNIFHQHFLALFVDESISGASGCSIDRSVHFVSSLGADFGIDFFGRDRFFYLQEEVVKSVAIQEFGTAYSAQKITDETLFLTIW
ncbi:MAG: hypothetical protein IPN29_12175 [Saprospiraceae bacterium]|nr:hypothetical protein [Saprospiraceae bacterium]